MTDFWCRLATAQLDLPEQIAVDPDGHPVFMSRRVWERHILAKRAYMTGLRHLLICAIESPDVTEHEHGGAIRYFAKIPEDGFGALSRHWLKVVVKYVYPPVRDGARTGLVSTARAARARELR
ncbi:MAG: hypothetical protein OXF32_07785 [Anaerolineaceae bacterium]|nr:hypothetical protein [Anaerolineaceae bacterium]